MIFPKTYFYITLLSVFTLATNGSYSQSPDPKQQPTPTPSPCSSCQSGSVSSITRDDGCANCYTPDEVDCLEDPDCVTVPTPPTNDNFLCSGWNDDPKCPSAGGSVCASVRTVVTPCSGATGCCRTEFTNVTFSDCQVVLHSSGTYYGCVCDPKVVTIFYEVCK